MTQGWGPGATEFGGVRGEAAWRLTGAGRGALLGAFVPRSKRWRLRELLSVVPLLVEGSRTPSPAALTAAALSARPSAQSVPQVSLNPATSSSPLIGTNPTRSRARPGAVPRLLLRPGLLSVAVDSATRPRSLYFRGLGGSSMFLHGDYQMAIVFPADPTQPLFGEAYLQDKNTNSGGQVGFPLQGITPQTYDRLGRPTSMTFSARFRHQFGHLLFRYGQRNRPDSLQQGKRHGDLQRPGLHDRIDQSAGQ